MNKGLSGRESSLKMIPTYARRPKGTEKGHFLAIDLGGTNLRVFSIKLAGKRKTKSPIAKKFVLQDKHITNTYRELFGFLAGCVDSFMSEYEISKAKKRNIGFTFSFPVQQRGIDSGILIHWTKGFSARGVKGKDVVELMNAALKRKGLFRAKVVALANDTVSTLVAKSYEDANCDVGVILGTGTNACYEERLSNIKKLKGYGAFGRRMIINIEWGNFNKVKATPYDRKLDAISRNPGEQLLEKMVSGMYLGRITALVAKDALGMRLPKDFKTEYMSIIEADKTKNLSRINALLRKLDIKHSKAFDRQFLKEISGLVSGRAARLSAVAIASVLTKINPALSGKHTIAIDGSVYEKHPNFSENMYATLKEIFGEKTKNIRLSLTKDASAKGAAIVAATL